MTLVGGVEAGGTKFVCAIGSGPDNVLAEARFATTTPSETMARVLAFFHEQRATHKIEAIGVASFGPVDPDRDSATFGYITETPKPGWRMTDVVGPLRAAFGLPVGFDTDVNGAVLAEHRWGAAQGLDSAIYLTVGTGFGGGALVNGRLVHGLLHPEMGHMRVPHDLDDDPYTGSCPYHGDCLEGLTCGPAMAARWGKEARLLPAEHPAWALQARYLAFGLANIVTILSPKRIIMGGGVMEQQQLFPLVRSALQSTLNGYIAVDAILAHIDTYVVPPQLGNRAGVLGAIALGQGSLTTAAPDRQER